MRKFAVVIALLSLGALAWAAHRPAPRPTAIAWHSYEDAVALAKRTEKATLVEFRAEWCHWCKKMEKEVYTQRDVTALGDRVVFARADEAQRPDLVKRYGIRGFPTVVLLDRNGREVRRIVGYRAAPDFVKEVRQALPGQHRNNEARPAHYMQPGAPGPHQHTGGRT